MVAGNFSKYNSPICKISTYNPIKPKLRSSNFVLVVALTYRGGIEITNILAIVLLYVIEGCTLYKLIK